MLLSSCVFLGLLGVGMDALLRAALVYVYVCVGYFGKNSYREVIGTDACALSRLNNFPITRFLLPSASEVKRECAYVPKRHVQRVCCRCASPSDRWFRFVTWWLFRYTCRCSEPRCCGNKSFQSSCRDPQPCHSVRAIRKPLQPGGGILG